MEGTAQFVPLGIDGISVLPIEGFAPDFTDAAYKKQFIARLRDRVGFIATRDTEKGGYDSLPAEALEAMNQAVAQAEKL